MMWRPRSARWFEALCPRAESAQVCAALARTGAVEIEARNPLGDASASRDLHQGLSRFQALMSRYGRYWRDIETRPAYSAVAPDEILQQALTAIEEWRVRADPLIDQLQHLEDERHRVVLCGTVMRALAEIPMDFTRLAHCGPMLKRATAILPADADLPASGPAVLHFTLPLDAENYLMAVGPAQEMDRLVTRIKAGGGRLLRPPDWLRGTPPRAREQIEAHLLGLDRRILGLRDHLQMLDREFELSRVLADLQLLEWFTSQVGGLQQASARFALVTGWCSDSDDEALHRALAREQIHALVHFPAPPADAQAPQLLDNPRWARPFEVLVGAMGVPGAREADPSPLLALAVPLLFGYMFGDVGQGLVLLALGWWLRGRFRLAGLLMAAGGSAAAFGLVFGSLFSLEHLIPALWLHPMEHPLPVLAAPLAFAVLLLSLGQLLNAAQAAWQSRLDQWLWTDAGFLLLYLGLAGAALQPRLAWLAALGALWILLGSAWLGGLLRGLAAIGGLLERGMQLLVNTLSFARVGAFALAHAGLSSAVVSLADATGSPWGWFLVLLMGNLLIILLEGLVVSIQTTRLILFEFFNRFLLGSGRVFRPLTAPTHLIRGDSS